VVPANFSSFSRISCIVRVLPNNTSSGGNPRSFVVASTLSALGINLGLRQYVQAWGFENVTFVSTSPANTINCCFERAERQQMNPLTIEGLDIYPAFAVEQMDLL
jgi:hypothetical protein